MGVQNIKRKIRLEEWSEQVRQCRDSGMTVSAWCEANGIKKNTYYNRQRAVADALNGEINVRQSQELQTTATGSELTFAEYKPLAQSCCAAITLHLNCGTLVIHNGADAEIIKSTLAILKNIC